MLARIHDFFDFFMLTDELRDRGKRVAKIAAEEAQGMTDRKDYEALAAIALHFNPRLIFEIGTYLGVTSDFLLALLPECSVVSISYQNPRWQFLGRFFNNSELSQEETGSKVTADRRARFTQMGYPLRSRRRKM